VATITAAEHVPFRSQFAGVYIVAVDGEKLTERLPNEERVVTAFVLPGEHRITFAFDDGNSWSRSDATLAFTAEAGRTYELHAGPAHTARAGLWATLTAPDLWSGWIYDRQGLRVVAKTEP
jgi:hypothetical protein